MEEEEEDRTTIPHLFCSNVSVAVAPYPAASTIDSKQQLTSSNLLRLIKLDVYTAAEDRAAGSSLAAAAADMHPAKEVYKMRTILNLCVFFLSKWITVVYFFHIFPYALGNGGLRRHSPVGIILHLIFTEDTFPYSNSIRR